MTTDNDPTRLTEGLARLIYEASDEWDWNGVAWEHQYGGPKQEALRQADAILTSDWLRDYVAAALAPVIAAERAAALREAADAGPSSTPTDELWASFLRERANREEARNV